MNYHGGGLVFPQFRGGKQHGCAGQVPLSIDGMTIQKLAYSITEAAEVASTSVSVLRRQIAANNLTVRYIGTKPVILAEELKAWLESLPTEAPAGGRQD